MTVSSLLLVTEYEAISFHSWLLMPLTPQSNELVEIRAYGDRLDYLRRNFLFSPGVIHLDCQFCDLN